MTVGSGRGMRLAIGLGILAAAFGPSVAARGLLEGSADIRPSTGIIANGDLRTDRPCAGLSPTMESVESMERSQYFRLYLPNWEAADSETLEASWRCAAGSVELDYSTGIRVVEDVNSLTDPVSVYRNLAAQDPNTTSVGTVHGLPAMLIDPLAIPNEGARGVVGLVEPSGTLVLVEGNGRIPLVTLILVAQSLEPR